MSPAAVPGAVFWCHVTETASSHYLNQCWIIVDRGRIWFEIATFSSKKMCLKMPSGKWRPFFLGLTVLIIRVCLCSWWLFVLYYPTACRHVNTITYSPVQIKHDVSFNHLHATFVRRNIQIYLQFISFLNTDMIWVVEILPHATQWPTYIT